MKKCEKEHNIRWLIRKDMPIILEIEQQSAEIPWSEDTFISHLRQRNVIGMIIENSHTILGFMLYYIHKNRIELIKIVSHPNYRRSKIGTAMINKLKSKLSFQRRNKITMEVDENNLTGQLFLKNCGFKCVYILNKDENVKYAMQFISEDI